MGTIAFPGGYIAATYGNLVQTFTMQGNGPGDGKTSSVSRKQHQRVNKIGGDATSVAATTFDVTRYPKRNGQNAAAGEPITITISDGSYEARLGGSMETFIAWLEANKDTDLYSDVEVTSPRGAHYGPFSPTATPAP